MPRTLRQAQWRRTMQRVTRFVKVSSFTIGAMVGSNCASNAVSQSSAGPGTESKLTTGPGQFMALSADRTHLVNTFTDRPVFITGDTAYNLITQLTSDADVETYLSDRQAKGIGVRKISEK